MLNVITKVNVIQQTQPKGYAARNNTITFNFVHDFDITCTWRDLAGKGKVTLPKNVYVRDGNNRLASLSGANISLGGFLPGSTDATGLNGAPIFMRGDKIIIYWGYSYFNSQGSQVTPAPNIFEGYISKVNSHKPVELEVMDNMYVLQKTQAPVKEWKGYTVGGMLQEMFNNANLPFTASDKDLHGRGNGTGIGNYRTGNETIAQVLARLRKEYNFEASFNGDVLYCGAHFYDAELLTKTPYPTFAFQQNIITDDLSYARVDDITISEVASTTTEEKTGESTKDGKPKTKKQSLQVLVTFKTGDLEPLVTTIKPGQAVPDNTEGERKTAFFPQANTIEELTRLATDDLQKFHYEGFRGKFTTFGQPFIQCGDVITIVDIVLPERNGNYWVRGVKYTGGVGGLRQEIELDCKIKQT